MKSAAFLSGPEKKNKIKFYIDWSLLKLYDVVPIHKTILIQPNWAACIFTIGT